jgi:hypothetical protein
LKTRIFWGIFALLAFLTLIPFCFSVHEQWEVFSKGNIVDVTIRSVPNSLATNGTLKFEYQGRVYSKGMSGSASRYLHIGDKIQMKFLEGHRIFLFPNDNPVGWGVFVLLLLFISGIFFIYYALRKNPPAVQAFGRKIA